MQATIRGTVVDSDVYDWTLEDGRKGTSYTAYVSGSPREEPTRVRCTRSQQSLIKTGVDVAWPVTIEISYGKLRVTLDADYSVVNDVPDTKPVAAPLPAASAKF